MDENVKVVLADPEGSGLYNKVQQTAFSARIRATSPGVIPSQVKFGVMYDRKEAEGTKRRHQVDTVVEGMCVLLLIGSGSNLRSLLSHVVWYSGINRMTNNIDLALPIIDDAFRRVSLVWSSRVPLSHTCLRITDAEAVAMSRYLVQHDGLFLGSSSACNLVACVKLAQQMGWQGGQTIVTVL